MQSKNSIKNNNTKTSKRQNQASNAHESLLLSNIEHLFTKDPIPKQTLKNKKITTNKNLDKPSLDTIQIDEFNKPQNKKIKKDQDPILGMDIQENNDDNPLQTSGQKKRSFKVFGATTKNLLVSKTWDNEDLANIEGDGSEEINPLMISMQDIGMNDIQMPKFAMDENIRDKKKRKKDHPEYDPTTLYIAPSEFIHLTPLLQQYWKHKADNYDKIVAIRIGMMYNIFGKDAFICHKLLDLPLNLWGDHHFIYFHDSLLPKYATKIISQGYKIVVVDQTGKSKDKNQDVVDRNVCQIITPGTYIDTENDNYSSRFLLTIFEKNRYYGITILDTTTHKFYIGEFEDDIVRSDFRAMLTKIKPIEIVYDADHISSETLLMLKAFSTKPLLSLIKQFHIHELGEIFMKFNAYFQVKGGHENTNTTKLPDLLQSIKLEQFAYKPEGNENKPRPWFSTLHSLLIALKYLEDVLLADTIFTQGEFMLYDVTKEKISTLYLDSQTIEHLELFEVNYLIANEEENSLFKFMDKTKSPYGKRLFKKWMLAPLMQVDQIIQRQEAVEDLMKNPFIAATFQDSISKLPDLERIIHRIYNTANKKRSLSSYFEDFAISRVHEFLNLLKELKKVQDIIEKFKPHLTKFKSKRLKQLINYEIPKSKPNTKSKPEDNPDSIQGEETSSYGIFPRINDIITSFEKIFIRENKIITPAPGMNPECDKLKTKILNCKNKLEDIAEEWREYYKEFNDINFIPNSGKYRYELEIPERLCKRNRPEALTLTSKRKGFYRFHTPQIEVLINELQDYERKYKDLLIPFIVQTFKKFYNENSTWLRVIDCLAELDCLCSLAKLAHELALLTGKKCRPQFISGDKRVFELKDMVHPVIAKSNPNFVANDIILDPKKDILILTGPNMGGKSTLLRQVCIAVLMAQMGSFIPASSFQLTPFDRIFSRVGASDRILEGKSTFVVELEETLVIVSEATSKSLVIIDELGRGTSTFDGLAIAYSVLKYLAENIKCLTLFSTHYLLLLEEFNLYENIISYQMASEFNEKKEEVKFLYKLTKGDSSKSYGILVAKMAGLPNEIINKAKEKADNMNKENKSLAIAHNVIQKFNLLMKIFSQFIDVDNMDIEEIDEHLKLFEEAFYLQII